MKYIIFLFVSLLFIECGRSRDNGSPVEERTGSEEVLDGIGRFHEVKYTAGLDSAMIQKGRSVYTAKCASCHKLNKETLVGPGWEGSTEFYNASWLMNFMTNTEQMLNENSRAKELLDIYQVRMPDQKLTDEEARSVLEFMRYIDNK